MESCLWNLTGRRPVGCSTPFGLSVNLPVCQPAASQYLCTRYDPNRKASFGKTPFNFIILTLTNNQWAWPTMGLQWEGQSQVADALGFSWFPFNGHLEEKSPIFVKASTLDNILFGKVRAANCGWIPELQRSI